MAEPKPESIPWTAGDAAHLRGYILQNPRFLTKLQDLRPAAPTDSNESRANYGSQVLGMDAMLGEIKAMMQDPGGNEPDAGYITDENET